MLLTSAVMIIVHTLRTVGGLTFHVAGNSSKRFLRHCCMAELLLYELIYVQKSDLSKSFNSADPAILGGIKLA